MLLAAVPGEVQFCWTFLLGVSMVLLSLRVASPHLLKNTFAVKIMPA